MTREEPIVSYLRGRPSHLNTGSGGYEGGCEFNRRSALLDCLGQMLLARSTPEFRNRANRLEEGLVALLRDSYWEG